MAPTPASAARARVEEQIGVPVAEWPPWYSKAVGDRRPFKYEDTRNNPEATHVNRGQMFCFLVTNGAHPADVLAWMHGSGRLSTDALGDIIRLLDKMQRVRDKTANATSVRVPRFIARTSANTTIQASIPSNMPTDAVDAGYAYIVTHGATLHGGGASNTDPLADVRSERSHYFASLCPLELLARLLHRADSPFQLRTVAAGERVYRARPVLSFANLRGMAHEWTQAPLLDLHAGDAYDATSQKPRGGDGAPLGTELALEIDSAPSELAHIVPSKALPGYDCEHGDGGRLWWRWLRHAVGVLHAVLDAHFGYTRLFTYASGGKSPYTLVCDANVLAQTRAQRDAVMEVLAALPIPSEEAWWRKIYEEACEPFYREVLLRSTTDGGFGLQEVEGGARTRAQIAALTMPTLDAAVATQRGHTHRLPFSIHGVSGRIAVPFASLDAMPTCSDNMPRVDDPQLASKLVEPIAILRRFVDDLETAGLAASAPDLHAAVPEISTAAWATRRAQKKRTREATAAVDADDGDGATLAPVPVDRNATQAWRDALQSAADDEAASLEALEDARVRDVAGSGRGKRGEWRERLRREIKRLDVLLLRANVTQLESRVRADPSGGRVSVHHPVLGQSDYLKTLHERSRHELSGHALLALDISNAHASVAWAAVLAANRGDEAAAHTRCPTLGQLATDRDSAVRALVQERGGGEVTASEAKKLFSSALNQDAGTGTGRGMLQALRAERPTMEEALLAFAPLASFAQAIRAKADASSNAATRLSLLMQAGETAVVRAAIPALDAKGWACAAVVADAVYFVRARSDAVDARAAADAMEAVACDMGVALRVKVEHDACIA
jgi:hypothetical protein